MMYKPCPNCGVNNDHGEKCECREKEEEAAPLTRKRPLTKVDTYILSALSRPVNSNERTCLAGLEGLGA